MGAVVISVPAVCDFARAHFNPRSLPEKGGPQEGRSSGEGVSGQAVPTGRSEEGSRNILKMSRHISECVC